MIQKIIALGKLKKLGQALIFIFNLCFYWMKSKGQEMNQSILMVSS